MHYRSSQDPGFAGSRAAAAVLTILPGALLALCAPVFGSLWIAALVPGLVLLAAGAAHLAATLFVRYELNEFELVVRRGIWRTRIPLECIEGVLPVRGAVDLVNPRPPHLTVVFQRAGRGGAAVITPEDPDAFLSELAQGAPFLERIGDRLLRRPGMLVE